MADKNKHLSCARNVTYLQRAHNVPRTLWNIGLNDSLVDVPKTT